MRSKFHLFFLVSCLSLSCFAQEGNSILWQISGNGLAAPSYLFGSIHITDKRVFDLPDSVLAKLKECEVTAFELNFDTVAGQMINRAIKKYQKNQVKDVLSKKEMEKLEKALKKRNIHIEDLNNETAFGIYQKYQRSLYQNNDMSTFLDAFLFGIAKRYGKNIMGIETYAEQASIFDNLDAEGQKELLQGITDTIYDANKFRDSLISSYLIQDMAGIYRLMHTKAGDKFEDVVLIKRNYVMCRRIDSLMKSHSMFICVGAGHLPGLEGLISLLEKKGYNVKPLRSPKSGYYQKLIPEAQSLKTWKTVYDESGGYKLKMPGEPTPINSMGIEMKSYVDFGTGYFYMSAAVPASTNEKRSSEQAANALIKRFEESGEILSKKVIRFKEMKGYDIEATLKKTGNYSIRIISDSSRTFLLMLGVANKKPERSLAHSFFESLELVERVNPADIIFKDDTAAFLIASPANFKITANEATGNGSHYKTFSCLDYSIQGYLAVTYVDYSPGLYFPDVKELYDKSFSRIADKLGELVDTKDFTFKGYLARDYKAVTQDKSIILIRYILRGTRIFMITVSTKVPEKETDALKRLNSFDLLDPLRSTPVSYTSPQKDFKVFMPPSAVIMDSDSSEDKATISREYGCTDAPSGGWFKIYSREFSKYQQLKNDSSLNAYFRDMLVKPSDSLIDSSVVVKNNLKFYCFKVISPLNKTFVRDSRAVVNGRKYYLLSRSEDLNSSSDSLDKALLNSFEILKKETTFDISASKKTILLSDLQSPDSLTATGALDAFKEYDFKKSDVPALQNALTMKFFDDGGENECRYWVYSSLIRLTDSADKVAFIKTQYTSMPDGRTRLNALNQLARVESPEAIDAWKDLMIHQTPKIPADDAYYPFYGRMGYDSVTYISRIFPDILTFLGDTNYENMVYIISSNALRHKIVSPGIFQDVRSKVLTYANFQYRKMKASLSEAERYYSYTLADAIEILNSLPPSQEVTDLNKIIVSDTLVYNQENSFLYLLKNNVRVEPKFIKRFLADPPKRNLLYENLGSIGRLDAYPSDGKKQKLFAEGDMYTLARADEDYDPRIESLGEKKLMHEGQTQRFFFYKIFYDEDVYFGMAGPFPLSDSKLITRGAKTSIDYEPFDSRTVDEHIQYLLEQKN